MTQQELEKYLWGAAKVLRSTIDAGDYNNTFSRCYFSKEYAMYMIKNLKKH